MIDGMIDLRCPACGETRRINRYEDGECHCAYCGSWFDFDDEPWTERDEETRSLISGLLDAVKNNG